MERHDQTRDMTDWERDFILSNPGLMKIPPYLERALRAQAEAKARQRGR